MTRGAPIPDTVTLHVPFRIVKRGGRKGDAVARRRRAARARTDSTLVKALARAFRWKRMLESGEFATIAELAEREGIAPSYMTRVLRLTLLAPDIVEAILDGKQGPEVTLARLLEPFPVEWSPRHASVGLLLSTNERCLHFFCARSILAEDEIFQGLVRATGCQPNPRAARPGPDR
jgi:hypothetical protein